MRDNSQKISFVHSQNQFVERKINEALQLSGKALPCTVSAVNGSIITVNFEVQSKITLPKVTCPLFGPEYIRYPVQVGDKGVVFSADASLGSMSGLGSGVATLTNVGNLSSLVFFPIGNKSFGAVDPNSVTIYGPNGTVLRDTGSATVMTLTPSGIVVTTAGSISMSAAGGVSMTLAGGVATIAATTINLNGSLIINGTPYLVHHHSGVVSGGNNSGGVV